MRLTADENRDAIKRYSHLRPARGSQSRCSALCPGTRYLCTLEMGHRGPHASHGALKRIKAVWDSGSSERLAEASAPRATGGATRRPSRTGSPVGLRSQPTRMLDVIWTQAKRLISSPDELVFLILFVAFVGFAIHWLFLIMG